MAKFRGTKEQEQLHKLVREAEAGKRQNKDRWGLPPVEKGWLRGHVAEIRQWDEPCEFGLLQVLEFDLREAMKTPGTPVRMSGTYFNNRVKEGAVVDVPDPTPAVRPVTPDQIFFSHQGRDHDVQAFYPGRGEMTQRKSLLLALLAVGVPGVVIVLIIAALYLFHILG